MEKTKTNVNRSLVMAVSFFMIASQAIGDAWWWPASYVEVVPQNPTPADVVAITLGGEWPDSCIPRDSAISVAGNDIYFDVIYDYPPGTPCATVISQWDRTESVGPLSPGTYTVYARLVGHPLIPETYTPVTEFVVRDPIIYVNADGTGDYPTIQAAIDAATDGDEIVLMPGTYTDDGNWDLDFANGLPEGQTRAITVRSTDPRDPNVVAATIINCFEVIYDWVWIRVPHRGFYFYNNEDANSIIAGLTITYGWAPAESHGSLSLRHAGGAIYCDNSSPTITHCRIEYNSASVSGSPIDSVWNYGGGIYLRNSNASITWCKITGNLAGVYFGGATFGSGGGIYCVDSNPQISHCTISNNSAISVGGFPFVEAPAGEGGGISIRGGSLSLIRCEITGNSAIGSYGVDGGNIFGPRSGMTGGMGQGGGIDCRDSSIAISHCKIISNSAIGGDGGGGAWGDGIYRDGAKGGMGGNGIGGGLRCDEQSTMTATNCVIMDNQVVGGKGGDGGWGQNRYSIYDIFPAGDGGDGLGGAIYSYDSESDIIRFCTAVGNLAIGGDGGGRGEGGNDSAGGQDGSDGENGRNGDSNGGAIYAEQSTSEISNSIFWDNRPHEIHIESGQSFVTFCDVLGGWFGQGNINSDPCFVNHGYWDDGGTPWSDADDFWVAGDYHLNWLSPCVNAGDPFANCTSRNKDMDDDLRVCYGLVDMGADEVYPIAGDFEPDGDVDLADFAAFAIQWQTSGYQAVAKLTASDGQNGDLFGGSVSISGNICVVGASGDPEYGICPGAAYVYRFDGSDWALEQELTAADGQNGDLFGISVSVDGNLCVVGACGDDDKGDDSGSAYVFRFDGSTWVQEARLLASDGTAGDRFGCPVSLSGNVCAVLARGDEPYPDSYGSVYIFRFNGTSWVQEDKISALDVGVNSIRSVSVSGDVCLIGTKRFSGELLLGSATTFRFDGYDWELEQVLSPSSYFRFDFGSSVSIDGNVCVVGDGHYDSGAAYVFRFDGNEWDQEQELLPWDDPSYDLFGASVSISGDVCVVGDSLDGDGSAYVFRYDGSSWTEECKLVPFDGTGENGQFGSAVSVDSENIIVGAPVKDNLTGAAYAFGSGLEADFNGDDSVNMPDLVILAEYWLLQPDQTLQVGLTLDDTWMYQNLPGQTQSNLTAAVSIAYDPLGNTGYTYEWEIILPTDVSITPIIIDGGTGADAFCTFTAPNCSEPNSLSDSGQPFSVKVTVTDDDSGNSAQAEVQFGIALLGDVNNNAVVNVADRGIINAFWQDGFAGSFSLRDCDLNCDGSVNVADRSIANAIWQGVLGANSVSEACPLR